MSQPAQPTPGAPAGQPPAPAPAPAAPTPAPAPAAAPPATQPPPAPPAGPSTTGTPTAVPPWERDGQTFDPERAWNLVQSLRSEVNTLKTGRQQDAQAHGQLTEKMKQLLGLGPDTTDPAVLAQRIEAAQDTAWKATVELAVHRQAGGHAATLLDSVEFLNAIDDIDADAGTPDFDAALAKTVQEAMAKRNLTAGQAPGPAPRFAGGADGGPRSGTTVPQITEAQLARMSPEQIVAAQEAGQLNDLLGIK